MVRFLVEICYTTNVLSVTILKKNKHYIRRGFTLLELLIVVIVIGIVSTIILTGTGSVRTEKQVDAAGRELGGVLRELQQYALTGKQFVTNTDPCLYNITWNSGSSNYTFTYYYKNPNTGVCDQQTVVNTYTLRSGITFSNTGSMGFGLPHGRPDFAGTSVAFQITKSSTIGVTCLYKDGLSKSFVGTNSCP